MLYNIVVVSAIHSHKSAMGVHVLIFKGLPRWHLVVKNPSANARDSRDCGSIPELGRSPGGGHGNPLQHPWLENPMDRGVWEAYGP